jgi:hypothetical protein
MKTIEELKEENLRLEKALEYQKEIRITYLIIEEGEGKYAFRYSIGSPSNFDSNEFIKNTEKGCEHLGHKILHRGSFTGKPENLTTIQTAVEEANQKRNIDINELEKILSV